MTIEIKITDDKITDMPVISDSMVNKAIKHVKNTYCDAHLGVPYMLLGDVVELIKITTGKEVDLNISTKYSK